MTGVVPVGPYLEPLRKTVTVRRSVAEAFEVFTAGIGRWWPLATYSIGQERARTCAIEPRAGGAVYEVLDDGERCPWGRVLAWEPPLRFVMSWHPGRPPEAAQEVEVRFTAVADGTRVDLEHRGWQAIADPAEARRARDSYAGGWEAVLGAHFAEACRS